MPRRRPSLLLGPSLPGPTVWAFAFAALWSPASAADARGVWLTEEGDAALTIAECGGSLCGRIVWLESATDGGEEGGGGLGHRPRQRRSTLVPAGSSARVQVWLLPKMGRPR